jgi:mannan endo-1,4-beta-mannosidase
MRSSEISAIISHPVLSKVIHLLPCLLVLLLCTGSLVTAQTQPQNTDAPPVLVDPQATPQTVALHRTLTLAIQSQRILFGHQNTTLMGVGWHGGLVERSDVQSTCGKMPAVYGWDYGLLGKLSDDGRDLLGQRITRAYDRGSVNTLCWHMWNPVTGKNFYDTTTAVESILPGGVLHRVYKDRLDALASFVTSLRGADGALVPLIFRPFHEHNKPWFWWGKTHCTAEQYAQLFRFTVTYLRDEKQVHNLLYAYSPDAITSATKDDYFYGYPGDEYVDILGYDHYTLNANEALPGLRLIVHAAAQRKKIAAFTETGSPDGLRSVKVTNYFTNGLLAPIKRDPVARQIAFLLLWQNRTEERFFVPWGDHPLVEDFKAFAADPVMMFEDELKSLRAKNPSTK